ncbi:MAG: PaaI family thioesterase [Ramlibacter sp.]
MQLPSAAFRLSPERRAEQLLQFNARKEVLWFGFKGAFEEPGIAVVTLSGLAPGLLGGGGTAALNGGVISAGFDAAFVLAGLGHYDSEVVVTLELSVKFLSLASASDSLAFRAHVVRPARNFSFAEGVLVDTAHPTATGLALATAMVAPGRTP